jgi:hypothetical protein
MLYKELERGFDTFLKYHMKMFLRDFNAKLCTEDIFKTSTGNESLQEIINDNGVGVVNIATSKNLTVKSTMFPHCNIHKFIWTSLMPTNALGSVFVHLLHHHNATAQSLHSHFLLYLSALHYTELPALHSQFPICFHTALNEFLHCSTEIN